MFKGIIETGNWLGPYWIIKTDIPIDPENETWRICRFGAEKSPPPSTGYQSAVSSCRRGVESLNAKG
jgi:hypothetical protein